MTERLYGELASWYALVDPLADHREEATRYRQALEHMTSPLETLLELGSGAGHNAFHLKPRLRCTLADLSEPMLERSRALNPECEHVVGDMRTLRLGRRFDAVLLHDAVVYMTTERDLCAAALTAFVHTRPGGAALFAPDYVRETFREGTTLGGGDTGQRSLRFLEWIWDPDPDDDTYAVEFAFLMRQDGVVRAAHERHIAGLFAREKWRRVLADVGYVVEATSRPLEDGAVDEVFVCRRP